VKKQWKIAAIFAATACFVLAALLLIYAPEARAALESANLTTLGARSGLPTTSLPILIARIIRVILGVLGIIFTALVIYAGYLYLTARGEEEPIKKAKKILQNAVIGLVIIMTSFAITTFILGKLLAAAGYYSGVSTSGANYTEPLSGSLGGGIIESHYPARNATDVPRNTRIMVTFKEAIDVDSIVSGYDEASAAGATAFDLNTDNILIYPSASEDIDAVKLASADVSVSFTDDLQTFDPEALLGSAYEDTNYTVKLEPDIRKDDGDVAFTGSYDDGYEWTFEVSTTVDMTPPRVVSVVPVEDSESARNTVIEITFSEAMDPTMASGVYSSADSGSRFANIDVLSDETNVSGVFSISNAYRTVDFISDDACGEDPCGETIYCLPGSSTIDVQAHAATLDASDPPQASALDGLMDAAGNTLDGDGDWGESDGEAGDDYDWSFSTSEEIDDTVPKISELQPALEDNEEVDVNAEVEIIFSMLIQASTINSSNLQLVPDQDQELWFSLSKEDSETASTAVIDHAAFWESVENSDGTMTNYYYYPVVTNGVKGVNQICMFPSYGPAAAGETADCASDEYPYCCNGRASAEACVTQNLETTLGE
jgi:hypothetical protein